MRSAIGGPNQVRIDRVGAGTNWMPLLARVLRVMAESAGTVGQGILAIVAGRS